MLLNIIEDKKVNDVVSGRLLVVDDEIDAIIPVCDILSMYGYKVAGFTSGKDALDVLKAEPFDLLLTDLIMPEMDGITLLREALGIDPSLVGIIITGQGTIQTAVEAMKVGAFDYMLKPLDIGMLRQILSRALSVKRLREAESKYRSIFENSIGGIYQTTGEGKCITANLSLARILRYKYPDDLIKNITDMGQLYVNPGRRMDFIHLIQGTDVISGFESQVYCRDGEKIWISESAVAVRDANGRFLYYEGFVEDITERKRAEEELKSSREQLRYLSAYLHSAIESERRYIAREIHDELGQMLTALKMDLRWMNSRTAGDRKSVLVKIKSMSELVDTAVRTVHKIATELRPGLLDDLGLTAAIEWQAGEFQKRTGMKCELSLNLKDTLLSQDISTAVYRILQEALTNIVRHAQATYVKIVLKEETDRIVLEIADDGKGITQEQITHPKSFGITGIRERVYLLGGDVNITGIPYRGTSLTAKIPLRKTGTEYD